MWAATVVRTHDKAELLPKIKATITSWELDGRTNAPAIDTTAIAAYRTLRVQMSQVTFLRYPHESSRGIKDDATVRPPSKADLLFKTFKAADEERHRQ